MASKNSFPYVLFIWYTINVDTIMFEIYQFFDLALYVLELTFCELSFEGAVLNPMQKPAQELANSRDTVTFYIVNYDHIHL